MAWGVLVALTLTLLTPGVALAEQENYYLGPDGVPQAQMMMNPLGGEMPNYDLGRDVYPGLLLERTTLGLDEFDAARHQQWLMDLSGQRLIGFPSMVVWSAAAGFEPNKKGTFTLYLLDCDRFGSSCEELSSETTVVETGAGGEWLETIVDLPELDHAFGGGRSLAVRIVVPSTSETDMMFAYGYPAHRSRLTIHSERQETAVSPVTVPSPPVSLSSVASPTTTVARQEPVVAVSVPENVPGSAVGPWLITVAISTAGLVGLGAILIRALTKPSRHSERPSPLTTKPKSHAGV